SSVLISPPAAVLVMATAKVRHGEAREQVLVSRPVDETNVRVAKTAWAGAV
ncbi:MAG: hypothetical protein QOI12_1242, partial [Alphaproteobacteria bacterium]|nr:hypothetical protein [Alphaproteobacteria bacterium]